LRSYLGVPVLADGRSVAVIEAVDVNQTGELEYYSSQLEETASTLAQRLDDDNKQIEDAQVKPGSSDLELNADSIVDLVLRQPYEVDETFEVAPTEWAVLNCVNGERQLRAVAEQASMPISQVVSVTSALVDRGLIRVGKENRRRL
jgi:GAF domain-containing protein